MGSQGSAASLSTIEVVPSDNPVFYGTLQQALANSKHPGLKNLPAPVYRCLEFLTVREAFESRNLFLPAHGSKTVMSLVGEFNVKGDVDLLARPDLQINEVYKLLDHFLCRLKTPIIPMDAFHMLYSMDILSEPISRAETLKKAIDILPKENRDILNVYFQFLNRVYRKTATHRVDLYTMYSSHRFYRPEFRPLPWNVYSMLVEFPDYYFKPTFSLIVPRRR
jgi:RalA-binding protein 1